jgi:hypothetical protein
MKAVVTARKFAFAVAALLALASVASSGAAWGHADRITFNKAVALPGAVLPAGSYTFEIANPSSSMRVVRVSSRETGRVHFSALTGVVERRVRGSEMVLLGEAPAGQPRPIVAWYPAGGLVGHRFIYR